MKKQSFTLFELKDIPGTSRDVLQSHVRRGSIKPSIQTADGPGRSDTTKALFSVEDIFKAKLFLRLTQVGFNSFESQDLSSKMVRFDRVGTGEDEFAYVLRRTKSLKPPLKSSGSIMILSEADFNRKLLGGMFREYDNVSIVNLVRLVDDVKERIKDFK